MDISIVMPNKNDLRMERLLESLDYVSCEDHQVEVLVILNHATEELKALCEKLKVSMADRFTIRTVVVPHSNFGVAYNAGVLHASYENILFLDSDLMCKKGSVQKMVDTMIKENASIVKAQLHYEHRDTFLSNLVYKSRLATTTYAEPPYIPVILIKKSIFNELDDGYMFPVDTVWCSDAEFAYRVMAKNIKISYIDAVFYHAEIGIKKDLHDAFLYGLGKGIRVKRTKEKWNPFKEAAFIARLGKPLGLKAHETFYLWLWGSIMQVSCFIQQFVSNTTFFKESVDFSKSASFESLKEETLSFC